MPVHAAMIRDASISIGLFAAVVLLYSPARNFEFTLYDDPHYVGEPMVQRGLTSEGVRWAFTTTTLVNWHPVTWLSHMLDAQLFGDSPSGAHWMSVLLHAFNATLLFWVLRALTGQPGSPCAIVAALWALHPMRVESVAWVAERKDLLCTLFMLLTIAAYSRYARRSSIVAFVVAILAFALGLMSKPMIVSLPLLLLLIDCWPLERPVRWRLLVEKIPFASMALGSCVVTYIAQRQGSAMSEGIYPWSLRLANAFWSFARYLGKTICPTGLSVFYPYHGALPGTSVPVSGIAAGVLILIGGTALGTWMWRRGNRAVLVGWAWFVIALLPVIGLVQVGYQSMADRYTYIPHIGLFIAIVWSISPLAEQRSRLLAGVACLFAVALALLSAHQLAFWRNTQTLFTHALEVTDHNHVAHAMLAQVALDRGDTSGALRHYQEQIAIKPSEVLGYYNIAHLHHERGDLAAARDWYERALQREANYADAHINLAHVLSTQGDHAGAIEHYRRGLRDRPDADVGRYNFAVELAEHGSLDEALREFEELIRRRPDLSPAYYSYALALRQAGRNADALAQLRRVREIAVASGDEQFLREIDDRLAEMKQQAPATGISIPAAKPEIDR